MHWVVQASCGIFCLGSCVSFLSTVLANFLNMPIIQMQNLGVKEWKKMKARMKIYKFFYSFKAMHVTLGMRLVLGCVKEKIKGRKQNKQGKGEKWQESEGR